MQKVAVNTINVYAHVTIKSSVPLIKFSWLLWFSMQVKVYTCLPMVYLDQYILIDFPKKYVNKYWLYGMNLSKGESNSLDKVA